MADIPGARRLIADRRQAAEQTADLGQQLVQADGLVPADVHRPGDDATIITWGAMVHTAAEAADELAKEGFEAEVVDLRTLIPWDKERVLEGVQRCSKVIVLHEDTRTAGFGAEIAATIAEEAFESLDAPVVRITAPDTPVPFAPPLEKTFIPQVEDVVTALKDLAAY